ncbi:hypothetical protein SAMN04487993_10592 [Salipiger marinus]|uniref:Uncharacterized protein n=1 Tax=Salipiger marinus TaxID=555512 RepID=A0A1G8V090_9RHOB|nr:hypothetical protein SAMN04487993_10592 [Salipiger marinus]
MDVDPLSDEISDNFSSFLPYRNEIIELVRAIARGPDNLRFGDALHSVFEKLLPTFQATRDSGRYREFDFDNYRFFARELFLYASAILIEEGRVDLLEILLRKPYYDHVRAEYGGLEVISYVAFDYSDRLLEFRNSKLRLNLSAPDVSLLKERSVGTGIRFEQLMEADFVLFLRSNLHRGEMIRGWYPRTLSALEFGHRAFTIFARARSKRDLDVLLKILGVESRAPLDELLQSFADKSLKSPTLGRGWQDVDVPRLAGFSELGTQS